MSPLGPTNPQLQRLRRLARRRSSRTQEGAFLVDGPVLLAEALEAGVELECCYAEAPALAGVAVRAASARGVPVREVADGALARVLDLVTPQHVVAVARRRPAAESSLWTAAARSGVPVLVLVAVQDPGNAGTLVRVAEAAGCAGVVATTGGVDLFNPKCVRAAAGSLFRVPVVEGADALAAVAAARAAGLGVAAAVGRGGIAPERAALGGACALLVGSEAHGLPADLLAAATVRLSVPMAGRVESLNAGVAGALLAFEAARQRRSTREPGGGGAPALGHDVGP